MSNIVVKPITACIGAEVEGIDLTRELSQDEVNLVKEALLKHLVLFFHDQNIDQDQHIAFARYFGELSIPPLKTKYMERPEITVLDQVKPLGEGADQWHNDNTFMANPPMGSILKAELLPSVGGDTCFANMYAAFDALSEPMKTLVEGLTAVHDITRPLTKAIRDGHSTADLAEMQKAWPPAEHPVVLTHPETKRKALYVNRNSTVYLKGVSERESELLLPFLCDHVRSPDYQCRFRWRKNSIAFWDNRCLQHFAVPDYNERRVMQRVTIK
ncbi:Alpha-ketoglutarate-dependent taurine dioxygenase [Halioglobus japonicus]|nr:Alpha-ketoglutarate-dependent taurine dioxygenase [Halioglobus japonicus]